MATQTEWWYWENIKLIAYLMPHCQISFDDEEGTWVHIKGFPLPSNFKQRKSDLLLMLPGIRQSIHVVPKSFYIDQGLTSRSGSQPSHIFDQWNSTSALGYAYFSLHLESWKPSLNVLRGDNFATLVNTVYQKLKEL